MTPKLTAEQREALDRNDGPVPVEDEQTHRVYFLVDESAIAVLQQQQDLAAVRDGVADMEAGRIVSRDERIRARIHSLSSE